ncbi:expressed hypothetical protein [Trichoplax adhaerens]|uniref:Glutathione transferase n=1 Tax=Trichoplax adhaerens TaxID=10228 RepID=B3S556_TRIAD|nr:expressed hypothetical protein [Trichoplax adhaerens]EDV22207.1 expressed hypothetical protein [Trichoplax adhaerens]|eukprot:XP_002115362.1 expressed hypothetical protein [Trichoplax adhaerens]
MSKIDFYSHLVSPPCRAVYMFMTANEIPFEYHKIDLITGEQKSEEYRKINPHQKVPALKDGDFFLSESIAMIQFLAQKYETPNHWYPTDIKRRAKIDEYLSWHDNCRQATGILFYFVAVTTSLRNEPRNEGLISERKTKLTAALDLFEKYFLKDSDFIGGNEISIADVVSISEFSQIEYIGIDIGKHRPKVKAWKERVVASLGAAFESAHQVLDQIFKPLQIKEEFE